MSEITVVKGEKEKKEDEDFLTRLWIFFTKTKCFCCKRLYRKKDMLRREEYGGGISTYLVGFYCLDCAKDHPIDFEYLPESMDFHTKLSICAKNYFKYYDTGLGWEKIPCPFTEKVELKK